MRMNDAEFESWSPGEAVLTDRSHLSLDWLEIEDDGESFAAFRALPVADKKALFASCVARTVKPQLAFEPQARPELEATVARLGIDFASHLRPTAAMLWSRIAKARILDIARMVFGISWASARSKTKKAALAEAMETAFAASDTPVGLSAQMHGAALAWTPPGFAAFDTGRIGHEPDDAAQAETQPAGDTAETEPAADAGAAPADAPPAVGGNGHAVPAEPKPEPSGDDAVEPGAATDETGASGIGALPLAGRRAQRGVGGKEDALVERDLHPLPEIAERDDIALQPAQSRPVAPCVLQQLVGLGEPEGLIPAAQPVVEDDGGDLPALAAAGAIAQHPRASPRATSPRRWRPCSGRTPAACRPRPWRGSPRFGRTSTRTG